MNGESATLGLITIQTTLTPMNAANALFFVLLGSLMEVLPVMFPAWFRRGEVDEGSVRAVWLSLMGGLQIAIGLGYLVMAHVVPFAARILPGAPATGALPLPAARGVNVR
jgi:hypothetical protein